MSGGSIEEVGSTASFFTLWFTLRQKILSFSAPEGSGFKAV